MLRLVLFAIAGALVLLAVGSVVGLFAGMNIIGNSPRHFEFEGEVGYVAGGIVGSRWGAGIGAIIGALVGAGVARVTRR